MKARAFHFSWQLGASKPLRLAAASIDRLVYDLYGLSAAEIAIVEGG